MADQPLKGATFRNAATAPAASFVEISELTRHRQLLLRRLDTETNRYERIALEDHIAAVEALIAGFYESATKQANAGGHHERIDAYR